MKYQISEIEKLYPNWYDKNSTLSLDDQRWIRENLPLTEENKSKELNTSESVSVNENESGTCKNRVKSELNWCKSEVIFKLKQCRSSTPPNQISGLLKEIFKHWTSKEGHWLWVAQNYTARTTNWVMQATIKQYLRGGIKKNPPAYFTHLIRFRKKRKQSRNTTGTYKNHGKEEKATYDQEEQA